MLFRQLVTTEPPLISKQINYTWHSRTSICVFCNMCILMDGGSLVHSNSKAFSRKRDILNAFHKTKISTQNQFFCFISGIEIQMLKEAHQHIQGMNMFEVTLSKIDMKTEMSVFIKRWHRFPAPDLLEFISTNP